MMILTLNDLSGISVSEGNVNQVLLRMTPYDLLQQTDFEKAFPIVPEKFATFDDLLKHSHHVQNLHLLPVKTDKMRAHYKTLDKIALYDKLLSQLKDHRFMLAPNEYEYLAPDGTRQLLLWVNNRRESHGEIASFIAKCLVLMRVPANRVILFERPNLTSTLMVKGTFPLLRHIHLWYKNDGTLVNKAEI